MRENMDSKTTGGARASALGEVPGNRARVFATLTGLMSKQGVVGGLRAVLPLLEGYARSLQPAEGGEAPPGIRKGDRLSFSDDERKVLGAAGSKLAYELIELASKKFPTAEGTEPYKAQIDPKTRSYPAPNLTQILSVLRMAQGFFGSSEVSRDQAAPAEPYETVGGGGGPAGQPVLLVAAGQGEYIPVRGPLPPQQIRRAAMSQRQMQLLGQPRTLVQVGAKSTATRSVSAQPSMASRTEGTATSAATGYNTAEPPCCGGGATPATTQMARYDENGKCASLFTISCETQWQLRNCFKEAICDFLYCLSSQLCEDGRLNKKIATEQVLGDCFSTAVCSLVRCLPDAICGPRAPGAAQTVSSWECDFAVEEDV